MSEIHLNNKNVASEKKIIKKELILNQNLYSNFYYFIQNKGTIKNAVS